MTITKSRQEFEAAVIQRYSEASTRILWFSTDLKVAPPQVCLLLTAARRTAHSGREYNSSFELNDQGNFRTGKQVEAIEVSPCSLLIKFRRGHGVSPGYVDADQEHKVREILVRFNLAKRNFEYLKALLDAAKSDGCAVRCRARRLKSGAVTPVAFVRP